MKGRTLESRNAISKALRESPNALARKALPVRRPLLNSSALVSPVALTDFICRLLPFLVRLQELHHSSRSSM